VILGKVRYIGDELMVERDEEGKGVILRVNRS
jgi:hypothetical protein